MNEYKIINLNKILSINMISENQKMLKKIEGKDIRMPLLS